MSAVEGEPALREVEGAVAAAFQGKTKGAGWFTAALALLHHRQFD
jgi:hypothetical protein